MSSGSSRQESVRGAWFEARELIWTYRDRLALGLTLMLVNRLAGLVLPASSKYLIDEVIANQRGELLLTIALAIGAAAVVQAVKIVIFLAGENLGEAVEVRHVVSFLHGQASHSRRGIFRYRHFDGDQVEAVKCVRLVCRFSVNHSVASEPHRCPARR